MMKSAVLAVLVLSIQAAAPPHAPPTAPAAGPRAVVLLDHSIAFFPASVPPSTQTAPRLPGLTSPDWRPSALAGAPSTVPAASLGT